jgi:predicted transcriptional regulator
MVFDFVSYHNFLLAQDANYAIVQTVSEPLARHIPKLAEALGKRANAIYQRQRALVAEGLLEPVPGLARGPAAVPATPRAVATLVVGMMASIELAGSGQRARRVAEAAEVQTVFAFTFLERLTQILSDEAEAAQIRLISVNTDVGVATIHYDDKEKDRSFYGGRTPEPALSPTMNLKGDAVRALAAMVKDIIASDSKGEK